QQAKDRQAADVRLARIERDTVEDEVRRLRQLTRQQATSAQEAVKAELRLREAAEKLARADLPVAEGRVDVLAKALEQLDTDDAVKRKELGLRQRTRQNDVEAA